MSQTLAQRRVLAAHARHRTPSEPSSEAPSSAPHDGGAAAHSGEGEGDPTDPTVSIVASDPTGSSRSPHSSHPSRSPHDPRAARPDRSSPMAGPAGRAVLTLVRAGARIVEVGPGHVRLHREGTECEVDPRGRVDWRAR